MGNVRQLGPARKSAMTTSSSVSAKLSSAPVKMPGAIDGSVMRKNVSTPLAPRSMLASSTERSSPRKRVRTVRII